MHRKRIEARNFSPAHGKGAEGQQECMRCDSLNIWSLEYNHRMIQEECHAFLREKRNKYLSSFAATQRREAATDFLPALQLPVAATVSVLNWHHL